MFDLGNLGALAQLPNLKELNLSQLLEQFPQAQELVEKFNLQEYLENTDLNLGQIIEEKGIDMGSLMAAATTLFQK